MDSTTSSYLWVIERKKLKFCILIWHHDIVLKHVSWKLYLTQALSRILNNMKCCREEFYKYSLSSSVWPSAAALNETVIRLSEINSKVAALNGKRIKLHVNLLWCCLLIIFNINRLVYSTCVKIWWTANQKLIGKQIRIIGECQIIKK